MANQPLAAAHPDWNVDVDEARREPDRARARLAEVDAPDSRRRRRRRRRSTRRSTPSPIRKARRCCAWSRTTSAPRRSGRASTPTCRRTPTATRRRRTSRRRSPRASGKPVERILPTFVNQPGVPLLDVSLACSQRPDRRRRSSSSVRHRRARTADAGRWQIPICVKGAGPRPPSCEVLTERDADADPRRAPARRGSSPTPARTATTGRPIRRTCCARWRRACETALTAPERLSLLDDEWALVRAGRHSAGDFLTLAAGFGREHASGVLERSRAAPRGSIARRPDDGGDAARSSRRSSRSLLRPLFDEVGFDRRRRRQRRPPIAARDR